MGKRKVTFLEGRAGVEEIFLRMEEEDGGQSLRGGWTGVM
jgi:hypothetical protein